MRVDHIGSTAVPGLAAKDVIDVQITVRVAGGGRRTRDALLAAGYPRSTHITARRRHTPEIRRCGTRGFTPRPTRAADQRAHPRRRLAEPAVRAAVLDWLKANPDVQAEYLRRQTEAMMTPDYAEAKEPWFADAYRTRVEVGDIDEVATLSQAVGGGEGLDADAAGAARIGSRRNRGRDQFRSSARRSPGRPGGVSRGAMN